MKIHSLALNLLAALSNCFGGANHVDLGPKKIAKSINGRGKSNAAQLKREAKKRNNIRKRK